MNPQITAKAVRTLTRNALIDAAGIGAERLQEIRLNDDSSQLEITAAAGTIAAIGGYLAALGLRCSKLTHPEMQIGELLENDPYAEESDDPPPSSGASAASGAAPDPPTPATPQSTSEQPEAQDEPAAAAAV